MNEKRFPVPRDLQKLWNIRRKQEPDDSHVRWNSSLLSFSPEPPFDSSLFPDELAQSEYKIDYRGETGASSGMKMGTVAFLGKISVAAHDDMQ